MRNGALLEGGRYWYYVSNMSVREVELTERQYQIDGDIDYCDPTKPITDACPFLPGQQVNLLDVPMDRGCSQSSSRSSYGFTLNPEDRFRNPTSPPPMDSILGTYDETRARAAPSPTPRWSPSEAVSLHPAELTTQNLSSRSSWLRLRRKSTRSASALRSSTVFEDTPMRDTRSASDERVRDARTTSALTDHLNGSHKDWSCTTRRLASRSSVKQFMHSSDVKSTEVHGSSMRLPEITKHSQSRALPFRYSQSWFLDSDDSESDYSAADDDHVLDHADPHFSTPEIIDERGTHMHAIHDDHQSSGVSKSLSSPLLEPRRSTSVSYRTSEMFSSTASCTTGITMSPSHLGQPHTPLISDFGQHYSLGPSSLERASDYFDAPPISTSAAATHPSHPPSLHLDASLAAGHAHDFDRVDHASTLTLQLPAKCGMSPRARSPRADDLPSEQTSGAELVRAWNDGAVERKSNLQELIDDLGYLGDLIA